MGVSPYLPSVINMSAISPLQDNHEAYELPVAISDIDNVKELRMGSDGYTVLKRDGSSANHEYGAEDCPFAEIYDDIVKKHTYNSEFYTENFSYKWLNIKWRGQVFSHLEGLNVVLRHLAKNIAPLRDLGLSYTEVMSLAQYHDGLIFFCGAPASGKSTTLASTMYHLRDDMGALGNALTLEQPIEHEYKDPCILQREVGQHIDSFVSGVKDSVRQTLHTIVIGEIRDENEAWAAVHASNSGYRVLATIHGDTIIQGLSRLLGLLTDSQRQTLAHTLKGVVAQHKVHHKPGVPPTILYESLCCDSPAVKSIVSSGSSMLQQLLNEVKYQKRSNIIDMAEDKVAKGELMEKDVKHVLKMAYGESNKKPKDMME